MPRAQGQQVERMLFPLIRSRSLITNTCDLNFIAVCTNRFRRPGVKPLPIADRDFATDARIAHPLSDLVRSERTAAN